MRISGKLLWNKSFLVVDKKTGEPDTFTACVRNRLAQKGNERFVIMFTMAYIVMTMQGLGFKDLIRVVC